MEPGAAELHVVVLLFPGFQLLDVAGPLDILNVLSRSTPLRLSILSTSLSPVSTLAAPHFSQSLVPTHTFSEPPTQSIDVLFVPGGLGSRNDHPELLAFLRTHAQAASHVLTVCTGSGLLAQSGVLDSGIRATSNKRAWPWVIQQGAGVKWVYEARWVVDGKFWTSSGVAAGMDMTLAWVGRKWGRDVAKGIANGIEYEWQEESTKDGFAQLYHHDIGQ